MRAIAILLLLGSAALAGDLPNPELTPGATNPALTTRVICGKGWSTKTVRNVPERLKREVYARYGMSVPHKGVCAVLEGCEVDHLISLTIGGSNDIKNLWPQPYPGAYGAHTKDRLEVRLHKLVCNGTIGLKQAQTEIRTDWVSAYRRYLGEAGAMR